MSSVKVSTKFHSYIPSLLANFGGIVDVHRYRLLHSWICYGNIYPPPQYISLPQSCALQSLLHPIYLTPLQHPFNKKENAFIIIMASAAANSALATEVLAVQRLYYDITPNAAASIFLLFSSQLLGYGIGGILRREFVLAGYMSSDTFDQTSNSIVSLKDALSRDSSAQFHA